MGNVNYLFCIIELKVESLPIPAYYGATLYSGTYAISITIPKEQCPRVACNHVRGPNYFGLVTMGLTTYTPY